MRSLYEAFPHARRVNREKGFTLIELLVVIAIIAILAAIAIPQFAKYRMRAFNSAAESDLRNLATAEEALFTDFFMYGASTTGTLANPTGICGQGTELQGPLPAATVNATGAMVAGQRDPDGPQGPLPVENRAVGIGISGSVYLRADTDSNCQSYVGYTRHQGGNTAYAKDSDNTAIYRCINENWPGLVGIQATTVTPNANQDDLNGQNCGGSGNNASWTAL